jgi:hypothetical protein
MAKNPDNRKLKIVEPETRAPVRHIRDLEKEERAWRISHDEAARRVHNLRVELEDYRDQLDAAQFDILTDDMPRSMDYSARRWAVNVMEAFNPRIKGLFERCDAEAKRAGADQHIDFNAQLFSLKLELAETGFAIGLLAGALFAGARPETIDRFERGLLRSVRLNHQIVR